jgi:hypothetical protein
VRKHRFPISLPAMKRQARYDAKILEKKFKKIIASKLSSQTHRLMNDDSEACKV